MLGAVVPVGAVVVVGAAVVVGAERVLLPLPLPVPLPVCASAGPKTAATNATDKADIRTNLLIRDLLRAVLLNSG
jgi:hypothetical protein